MSLGEQLVSAALIGGVSAACASPCDMIMVRMQADGHWPAGERRGRRLLRRWTHRPTDSPTHRRTDAPTSPAGTRC